MRKNILFLSVSCISLFSCKKLNDNIPTSLEGKWKMISVKDIATGNSISKPSSVTGEVLITFKQIDATNGTFYGNTPANEVWENDYSISSNQFLTIPQLAMTKVGERDWGNYFSANIEDATSYLFLNGSKLNIITDKKNLIFVKQ